MLNRKAFLTSKRINIPSPGETRWYFKARIVSAIFKRYEKLQEAFTEIQDNPVNFTDETVLGQTIFSVMLSLIDAVCIRKS